MQKGANPLFSFLDWYYRITAGLAVIVLIIITGIITAEILFRLILNESIQFVMQFSGYSLYIVTFLSAAWVLREGSHIVIDFVTAKFSERTRHIVSIAIHVLAVLLCAFLFWQAADYTYEVWRKGMATPYPIVFSLVYLYFLMPLGFFFLTVEFLVQTWEKVSNKGRGVFCLRKGEAASLMKTIDM